MPDSFADLWNSTAPVKPAEPPRKLGAANTSAAISNLRKSGTDAFSMLAAASSNPGSRSITPSYTGSPRFGSSSNTNSAVKPIQKVSSNGGDAFSGLLSGSIASSSSNGANMTIAQRAALVEKQRSEQLQQHQVAVKQNTSGWEGLDSLGTSSFAAATAHSEPNENDWLSEFTSSAPTVSEPSGVTASPVVKSTSSLLAVDNDDWGLHEFVSKASTSAQQRSKKPSGSLWDLDDFESPAVRAASVEVSESPMPRTNSPGDFDFGNREDGLLDDQSDDDDILGDLSKPVDKLRRPSATPSPQPISGQRSRAVSPPPHIVGQIVEMGFSPQQARIALASTETGLDVQAALDTLLSNGAGSSTPPAPREETRERYHSPDEHSDDDHPPRRRIPPRRDREREVAAQDTPSPGGETQRNLQEQADKLLAQASEIGLTMFNRANSFWKEGKVKVQKAYEERAKAAATASPAPTRDGRPKWMQEVSEHRGDHDDGWGDHEGGGFKDDHDHDEVLPPHPSEQDHRKPAPRTQLPPQTLESEPPSTSSRIKTGNMFSDDPPAVYVSPFRRKTPSRAQSQTSTPPASAPKPNPPRAPPPVQLVLRKTVSASSSALTSSVKHKAAGTEMFKLGRYAEAETSYSSAIAALPDSHLLLIPLYNNRALTRIKTGDHTGAIEDCTTVINLIGASYHPSREAKVTKEDEGASVDLADGLIKALRRRAEAHEGKEKWDSAMRDWEAIAAADFAGKVRNEAVRGAGRCRRMFTVNVDAPESSSQAAPPPPKPKSKPKPKSVQREPTPPSDALNRVREANQAAEAEDQARHELKDVVEARLTAWKGGKETNIRALIASLETVLWPELGWQKVGMHELVSPNQVKIRYTKAIAKLHPDKLNVNNTTLEQRMIANGVFGSLNEAWNAFKQ